MNIQQNITTEMLLSLVVVGTMALVYLSFRLSGRMHNRLKEEDDADESLPYVGAGQLWYRRSGPFEPFINKEVEPIKILEYRSNTYDGWVRFELDGQIHTERVSELVSTYTMDEFDDMIEVTKVEVQPEIELSVAEEVEEMVPSVPSKNIVSIDGKEFVLTPVVG